TGASGGGAAGGGSGMLKAPGASCGSAGECASQFCVDGVCCSSACTGACQACSAARTGGTSGTCSPVPNGGVCRPAAGACDVAEVCTEGICAADTFLAAGTTCRAGAGDCDVSETCSGTSAQCPSDGFLDAGVLCRAGAGFCDVPEACTGASASCPSDAFVDAGTTCRASTGVCDPAEACTGGAAACPGDALADAGTVCRAAAGACDVAEQCDGFASTCPTDGVRPDTFVCRPVAGPCDREDYCDGVAKDCTLDSIRGSTSQVCSPYRCTDTGVACTTSCTVDADCAPNARSVCQGGTCVVAHLAFVTSLQLNSNFGGVDAGDTICRNLAADAGLGSNFKAWTSSGGLSPSTTFNRDAGLYVRLVDKARIAVDWADLTNSTIVSAISYTEKKTVPAAGTRHTFTGTSTTGAGGLTNCADWTSNTTGTGTWGTCDSNTSPWTVAGTATPCSALNGGRLYCFEQ
ncbi:MAG: hypothetical protein K1X89_14685, partial [Myxococcaceae bacterium]|nr:hypothetical protein [Myxococcaceae bacterium]